MPNSEVEAQRNNARRVDTRRKIQLGGLVIKAGIGGLPPAVILGVLLDGADRVADGAELARLKQLGHLALVGEPG
jgi:hypothetical protein